MFTTHHASSYVYGSNVDPETRYSVGRDTIDPFATTEVAEYGHRLSTGGAGYARPSLGTAGDYSAGSGYVARRDNVASRQTIGGGYTTSVGLSSSYNPVRTEPIRAVHYYKESFVGSPSGVDSSTYINTGAVGSTGHIPKHEYTGSTYASAGSASRGGYTTSEIRRNVSEDRLKYVPDAPINPSSNHVSTFSTSTYFKNGPTSSTLFDELGNKKSLGYYREMLERIKKEDVEAKVKKEQQDKEFEMKREKAKLYRAEDGKVDYLAMLKSSINTTRSQSRSKASQFHPDYSGSGYTSSIITRRVY